jgi:hypothetical protein
MKLPARPEGPHCWLWLLLYQEAGRAFPISEDARTRTQAAGRLWERVIDGSMSIKRDRSGLNEEADPWLSEVVEAEARRHLELSAQLDDLRDDLADVRGAKAMRPIDERSQAVGQFIWRQLGNGWARVAEGEDAILFWDPDAAGFVPFSLGLSARYAELFSSARP